MANRTKVLCMRPALARRHNDGAAVVLLLLLISCRRSQSVPMSQVHEEFEGWKLWSTVEQNRTVTRLSYRTCEVRVLADLTTPLGTFTPVARRHEGSPSGWAKASEARSSTVPLSGVAIDPQSESKGYYEGPMEVRKNSSEADWVYVKGREFSGWARASKLCDQTFLRDSGVLDRSTIWK